MPCVPWQVFDQDYIRERILVTESGCWEWQRGRYGEGYGNVTRASGEGSSHRLAWKVFRGEIPWLMEVLHKCDNPPCCNPDHLFLGTKSDNSQDALKKGRLVCDPTKAALAKMIPQKIVDDIIERVERGESKKEIAKLHDIHVTSIYNIINGKYTKLRASSNSN